ncbi:MAG: nucleotidyltransferase family protein [Clostridia bacterium]
MKKQGINAVILAAGMGRRMGSTKQLLTLQGGTVLEQVIRLTLAVPFQRVYAVIGHEAERIFHEIKVVDPRFRWLINREYHEGQSTSFKLGMEQASQSAEAVMVLLGDQPFISSRTIEAVYEQGIRMLSDHDVSFVIQPVYEQKPGHPVLFGNCPLELFSSISGDQGAKPVFSEINVKIGVPVDDPGIHFDLDTPEDVENAKSLHNKARE